MAKRSMKQRVALGMVFFFVFHLIGCGGGGGGGSDSSKLTAAAGLEKNLTKFNTAVTWVTEDMTALYETVNQLNTAIAADDGGTDKTTEIGTLTDQFGYDADALLASIESMDLAEAGIQDAIGSETGASSALVTTIIGVGLVIHGLYSFGKKMKSYSDDMTEARKDRDEAAEDLMNDEEGAEEDFNNAKKDMNDIGTDAAQEFTTKVASDLILSPINPTSTTGVIIKHIAGNELQDRLKVISSTEECEDGYESAGCKIGIDETDDEDSAATPPGKNTVVITGDDLARIIVEKEITEDTYEEVTFDPLPIKDAAEKMIPSDEDDPGDDPRDEPALTLSSSHSGEDADSITYTVAAAVSGVTGSTSVTISVENAATSGATKTLSADGTVFWSVTVLSQNGIVTVTRSDTGATQSLTLPGKTTNYNGTYTGTAITTFEGEDCWCWDTSDATVYVNGSSLSGSVTGTLSGNLISGYDNEYTEILFTGTINGNVMSGTWRDSADGCCSGTFSLTKQ